jgi:hypothetical protein
MRLEPTQVSDEEDKLMPSVGAKVAAAESEKETEENSVIGDTTNRARHCRDCGKLSFLN